MVWKSFRVLVIALIAWAGITYDLGSKGHSLLERAGHRHLLEKNRQYLTDATEEAMEGLLLFSALKAGLAVMQSSQAGISFLVDVQVQVGRFFDATKDLVDHAWQASLLGLATLGAIRLLLESLEGVTTFVLTGFSIAVLTHLTITTFIPKCRWTRSMVRLLLFFLVLAYVTIPLSILAAATVSRSITAPTSQKTKEEIRDHHGHLIAEHDHNSLKNQASTGVQSYMAASKASKGKEKHLIERVALHAATIFFDAILFPLGFLTALIVFSRKLCLFLTEKLLAT